MKKRFTIPAIAAKVSSDISDADLKAKLAAWNAFQYERVGFNLRPELVAVEDAGDAKAFANVAKTIAETSEFNLILMSDNVDAMKAAVEAAGLKIR
ncbi:MAG: hypothetical protein R2860_16360 [Desulfobacterales bacterium]